MAERPQLTSTDIHSLRQDYESFRKLGTAIAAFDALLAEAERLLEFGRIEQVKIDRLTEERTALTAQVETVRQEAAREILAAQANATAQLTEADQRAREQIATVTAKTQAEVAKLQQEAETERTKITNALKAAMQASLLEHERLDAQLAAKREELDQVTAVLTDRRDTLQGQVTKAEEALARLKAEIRQTKEAVLALGGNGG